MHENEWRERRAGVYKEYSPLNEDEVSRIESSDVITLSLPLSFGFLAGKKRSDTYVGGKVLMRGHVGV